MSTLGKLALYASVGSEFLHYDVDVAGATLTKRGAITMRPPIGSVH